MNKKNHKRGFTLAELLIVVAIIAVLVAVAIPVFTAQLNKAKYATDVANARAIYAELSADYLANGVTTVKMRGIGVGFAEGIFSAALFEIDSGLPCTVEVYDKDGNLQNTYSFTGIADYIEIGFDGTSTEAPGVAIYRDRDNAPDDYEMWGNDGIL